MDTFKHAIQVKPEDIDEMGHVNNVVYVRYVQEVAAAHWDLHEEITGTTWVGDHQGARFERFVKLTRTSDQKVVAEAKTIWCMLDAKSMRPLRIGEDVLGIL